MEFFLGLFFGENIGPKDVKKQKTALLQFSSRSGTFVALFRWINFVAILKAIHVFLKKVVYRKARADAKKNKKV